MRQRTTALLEETRALDSKRPVLRRGGEAGDAWKYYNLAFDEIVAFPGLEAGLEEYAKGYPKNSTNTVRAILSKHSRTSEFLRRGALTATSKNTYVWDSLLENGADRWGCVYKLAVIGVAQARLLFEEERFRDAAEAVLDVCQFSRDAGSNTLQYVTRSALLCLGLAFNTLRVMIISGKLSADILSDIERGLAILDGSFIDTALWIRNGVIHLGTQYQAGDLSISSGYLSSSGRPLTWEDTWRCLFSEKLFAAQAFRQADQYSADLLECDQASWSTLRDTLSRITAAAIASGNQLAIDDWNTIQSGPIPERRGRLVELRLLRVAAAYRARGDVLGLADPFGSMLRHIVNGNILKVWSVGPEGKNTTGVKNWFSFSREGNLTLEVTR